MYQVNLGPSPYAGFADTQGENGFQECSHKSWRTAAWALYGCKSRGLTSATTLPYNHPPANETSDISSYLISDSLSFSLTFHLCAQSKYTTRLHSGALYLLLGISNFIIRVRGQMGWRGTETGEGNGDEDEETEESRDFNWNSAVAGDMLLIEGVCTQLKQSCLFFPTVTDLSDFFVHFPLW